MLLNDPSFDTAVPEARDSWLLEMLRQQIAYMREKVPFWHERLSKARVHEEHIRTLADLRHIPVFKKEELRRTPPVDLVPTDNLRGVKISRWTSGTSGRPTVNFWTEPDWAALVTSTARMLGRQAPMPNPTAFVAYSQAHVTGPLYHCALKALNSAVYDRSHHPEEFFPTLQQIELFSFDTLVLPAKSMRGKGVGLNELLNEDESLLMRKQIRWWIGSSGTFDAGIILRARSRGVQAISNLYGSSEFALFAISCPENPGDYHVAQGHVLVEVVDESGVPVQSGQFGRIVVTHLCGMAPGGNACRHTGTQILRLAAGDGATLIAEPCMCGLTTPRLRGVRRLAMAAE